jgi:hypothetical protein
MYLKEENVRLDEQTENHNSGAADTPVLGYLVPSISAAKPSVPSLTVTRSAALTKS